MVQASSASPDPVGARARRAGPAREVARGLVGHGPGTVTVGERDRDRGPPRHPGKREVAAGRQVPQRAEQLGAVDAAGRPSRRSASNDSPAGRARIRLSRRRRPVRESRPVVTLAPAQPVPAELLSRLDPILVNEHEAAFLLQADNLGDDAQGTARELLRLGPASAVITLGAAGAAIADSSGTRPLPAVPVEKVVDTTGAGDAFAGALAAALADGADLDAAVSAGLRAGAKAVGRNGTR